MTKISSLPADDTTCGWYHLSKGRPVSPAHRGNTSARWVIVGAGFTGLATARQLAEHFPDEQIVLIEAQEVGFGTSGRNAGFVIDLPHDIGAPDYIGDINIAKTTMKLNLTGKNYLKALVEQFDIDCQLKHCGKYQAAVENRGIAVLDAYRSGLDKLDQPYQMIEGSELPDHIGTHFYRKALFTPGTSLVQPSALVKGLADTLPKNVTLYENTPITEVEYGQKTLLKHAHGSIIADKLILANNAFGMSFGFLKGRMLPVFTYASLTHPMSQDEQARLGGKAYWGVIPADPFGTTVRRTPDNRLLIRNSFSFNPDGRSNPKYLERFVKRHRASFERRFPMLPGLQFAYTWGGALALSRNHEGYFGELRANVYGALGCNGLGVTRGTATGKLMADWLAGERSELIDFVLGAAGPCANPPAPLVNVGVNLNLKWGQFRAGQEG
ncbi:MULTISPECIES: FAD-binding oxidoreductase [Pseudomonas]|uniref:Glycine/D-amino acid oxidase-like deaminating enzyme n=1 Tax=Pseudomonas hunanensis TaxID=1247546 RepID=A0ACC6K232_9PSED|nr:MULTISPECIES: FAD-binding oxidoreductase [Pseudomonas]MBP2261990.1 glycine/D-amino acid oxidase-like deaminating enzyme [Pseudomonas sp. BP8]MDR6712503.1 glycine/D-amino acid oxidase-like deaminating enzyme [Pseudomonas hunanensis]HDS1735425.1 FAD-binding oxidoreductase [Pseudomonas putida]